MLRNEFWGTANQSKSRLNFFASFKGMFGMGQLHRLVLTCLVLKFGLQWRQFLRWEANADSRWWRAATPAPHEPPVCFQPSGNGLNVRLFYMLSDADNFLESLMVDKTTILCFYTLFFFFFGFCAE